MSGCYGESIFTRWRVWPDCHRVVGAGSEMGASRSFSHVWGWIVRHAGSMTVTTPSRVTIKAKKNVETRLQPNIVKSKAITFGRVYWTGRESACCKPETQSSLQWIVLLLVMLAYATGMPYLLVGMLRNIHEDVTTRLIR